jgi:tetratricopeptide (TPR) repeat protein
MDGKPRPPGSRPATATRAGSGARCAAGRTAPPPAPSPTDGGRTAARLARFAVSAAAAERLRRVSELIARREFPAAAKACALLNRDFPAFAPGWHAAAFVALAQGAVDHAIDHVARALAIQPDHAPSRLLHARCLLALGRFAEARRAALALTEGPANAAFWGELGTLLQRVNEHHAALRAYDRGIELHPAAPELLFNRATVRRFVGDLTGAEADYDRVVALRPDDCEAYLNRSELRPQSAERNHVAELEARLALGGAGPQGEVQLCYALAKEYEDLGAYAQSFAALNRGATLRRRHLTYDVSKDVATVGWIIESFAEAAALSPATSASGDAPIFVVGLPRSGTTLVDRILSSHPDARSAGELNAFATAVVAAVARVAGGKVPDRRTLIARSAAIDFQALGLDYLDRAAAAGFAGRFVDKMPLNYLYCGLIARALPGAAIVHVERHPMAVCYAMYKTLFQDGYPFSYSLAEIAAYYAAYRRLMQFWQAALPGRIHCVAYENLVTDQHGETRRLLAACGLPWDDACLRFHENAAPTTTASASQVRRPLYASSIHQWRHYETQLAELRDALESAGIQADPPSSSPPRDPDAAGRSGA